MKGDWEKTKKRGGAIFCKKLLSASEVRRARSGLPPEGLIRIGVQVIEKNNQDI